MLDNRQHNALRSYAYELVINKKTCYAHLNEDERYMLTGLIIKSSPILEAHEFTTEADRKDELPYLLADFMTLGTKCSHEAVDKAETLIQFMIDKASEYASVRIDKLLEDIDEQYQFDKKHYIPEE